MGKSISPAELQRRKEQSIKDNPIKYQKACLKRGCCKNCVKNELATRKVSSSTVFGSYFSGADGFGTSVKYRKCGATNKEISNEYCRCEMYERVPDKDAKEAIAKKEQTLNTILGIR